MKTYKIAAIPGDGIGTEVISAGVEVLQALASRDGSFAFKVDQFDWGGEYYKTHGRMMPENGRDQIKNHDAILFGSAGHPDIPDHITLWGLRLAICQPFDQYANVRPTRVLPGITSPLRHVDDKELDWVIVRENSEGEYCRRRRPRAPGLAARGRDRRLDVHARRRRAHHALRLQAGAVAAAQAADRRHQVERAAPRHGDVGRDRRRDRARVPRRDLGQDAGRRDDHAHGDEAAVASTPSSRPTCTPTSCPISPPRLPARSASRRPPTSIPERAFPSMFEPIHGSAFDIMGKGIANPDRHLLVGRDAARAPRREAGRRSPDGGDRARDGRSALPHARPRWQGAYRRRDGCRDRCHSRLEHIAAQPETASRMSRPNRIISGLVTR